MSKSSRISFWDNVKALGIISIVLGHFCLIEDVALFAYSYHLVIFFFAAGALFNAEKHGDRPLRFALGKLGVLWIPYVCYMSFFTLIHNLTSTDKYSLGRTLIQFLKNLVFMGSESMGGALWFVPFMLMGMFAFCGIVFICRRITRKYLKTVISFICILIGVGGLIVISRKIYTPFHINLCMIVLPVILAGFLFREHSLKVEAVFRWWGAIPCAAYLIYTACIKHFRVDFSHDEIGTPERFYLISFCGIYLICTLARYISKCDPLSRIFSFIGRYSFDIMALQFLVAFAVRQVFSSLSFNTGLAKHFEWVLITLLSLILSPLIRILCAKIKDLFKKGMKLSE